jgi:hypothetical protein
MALLQNVEKSYQLYSFYIYFSSGAEERVGQGDLGLVISIKNLSSKKFPTNSEILLSTNFS